MTAIASPIIITDPTTRLVELGFNSVQIKKLYGPADRNWTIDDYEHYLTASKVELLIELNYHEHAQEAGHFEKMIMTIEQERQAEAMAGCNH